MSEIGEGRVAIRDDDAGVAAAVASLSTAAGDDLQELVIVLRSAATAAAAESGGDLNRRIEAFLDESTVDGSHGRDEVRGLDERVKTGGAQMSRVVSSKMKEILQSPTPESKMVDEATSEHMEDVGRQQKIFIVCFSISLVSKAKRRLFGPISKQTQLLQALPVDSCPVNCIHWVEREELTRLGKA